MRENAIKNLKNGLFEVKFDGESAELWCSKAQGESFFQTRCDFGSFRDLFLGAVVNNYSCLKYNIWVYFVCRKKAVPI